MLEGSNQKKIELENISFEEIKKIELDLLGLKKINSSNIYRYESKPFKLLKFKISPCMDFVITSKKSELLIQLNSLEVLEVKNILDNLSLKIELRIYDERNICYVDRSISLKLIEKKGIFKTLPSEIISKLLLRVVVLLSTRLDRKLKDRLTKFLAKK